jgi:hypothetical protein
MINKMKIKNIIAIYKLQIELNKNKINAICPDGCFNKFMKNEFKNDNKLIKNMINELNEINDYDELNNDEIEYINENINIIMENINEFKNELKK